MAETKAKAKTSRTSSKATQGRNQALAVAETALDLHVGAVLGATDRFSELVEPLTDRGAADKQLKAYRAQLRRTLKRTERRGATARRKATTEARKRRRSVQSTVKRNRAEVEQRVRRAIEAQTSRAQDLVDQVGSQLSALR